MLTLVVFFKLKIDSKKSRSKKIKVKK